MSKPWIHSLSSAKLFGGKPEDYLPIHDLMDSSKSVIPDVRHRAIFHSAFGIFIVEKVFGHNIINSECKEVSVRDIAEQHIVEDLGTIPTLQDWFRNMPIEDWMSKRNQPDKVDLENLKKKIKKMSIPDPFEEMDKIIPPVPKLPYGPMFPGPTTAPISPAPLFPTPPWFPGKMDIMD